MANTWNYTILCPYVAPWNRLRTKPYLEWRVFQVTGNPRGAQADWKGSWQTKVGVPWIFHWFLAWTLQINPQQWACPNMGNSLYGHFEWRKFSFLLFSTMGNFWVAYFRQRHFTWSHCNGFFVVGMGWFTDSRIQGVKLWQVRSVSMTYWHGSTRWQTIGTFLNYLHIWNTFDFQVDSSPLLVASHFISFLLVAEYPQQ